MPKKIQERFALMAAVVIIGFSCGVTIFVYHANMSENDDENKFSELGAEELIDVLRVKQLRI